MTCWDISYWLFVDTTSVQEPLGSNITLHSIKGKPIDFAIFKNSRPVSFWAKSICILMELVLGMTCVICIKENADISAIVEWTMVFLFTIYVSSFAVDMYVLPAPKPNKVKF